MEDKYIQLLKKAKKEFESDVKINRAQFKERLENLKIDADTDGLWRQIYNTGTKSDNDSLVMGLDAYFKLLEYEELKQAREASADASKQALKASRQARKALWISIIALGVSIFFSVWEIFC